MLLVMLPATPSENENSDSTEKNLSLTVTSPSMIEIELRPQKACAFVNSVDLKIFTSS